MRGLTSSALGICVLLAACLLGAGEAMAAAAVVTNLNGTVSARKPDGSMRLLSQKSEVEIGEVLSSEKNSYAKLKFTDGGEVTLRPSSSLTIDAYTFQTEKPEQDSFIFSMVKGGMRTLTGLVGKRGNRDAYRYNSVTATIGIRGTDYGSLMCISDCGNIPDGEYFDVKNGKINIKTKGGSLDVEVGEYAYVKDENSAPILLPGDPGLPPFDEDSMVGNGMGTIYTGIIPEGSGCFIR